MLILFIYMRFCINVVVLNRSYSNTQPIWKQQYPTAAWESQVCSIYNLFLFCIFNRYNWYYVTRTSANGSAVSLSRDTEGNHLTSSWGTSDSCLKCIIQRLRFSGFILYPFHFSFTIPLTQSICSHFTVSLS